MKKIFLFIALFYLFQLFDQRPTVYIDPSAAVDGVGTLLSPHNTWTTITPVSGYQYLWKRGTIYTTSAQIRQSQNNVRFGAYGPGTTRPIIAYSTAGGKALDFGATFNCVIDSLEIYCTSTGQDNWGQTCIHFISGGRQTVTNCILHGGEWGLRFVASPGWKITVKNTEIYNTADDGCFIEQADSADIEYNNIHDVNLKYQYNTDQAYSGGDCLQFATVHWYKVLHNILDHSSQGNKFCWISENSDYGGISHGIFMYNHCKRALNSPDACVYLYSDQHDDTIAYNIFESAQIALFTSAIGNRVFYNEFYNIYQQCYRADGASNSDSTKIVHNTIYNAYEFTECYNEKMLFAENIVYNCTSRTFYTNTTNIVSDYNCYYNNADIHLTLGAHDITSNPQLTNVSGYNFTLLSNSPCINAGNGYLGNTLDFIGTTVPTGAKDDIGCLEYLSGGAPPSNYEGNGTISQLTNAGNSSFYSLSSLINNPVTSLIVAPSTATIAVNGTQQLTGTTNSDATIQGKTWTSNATGIATVNSLGLVTGVSGGIATITATSLSDGNKIGTSVITVNVPVTGVSISPTSVSIAVGATQQLTPTISPANATNQNVTYSSANSGIASVSSPGGLITAVASGGPINITVHTRDGGFTANCATTVTASTWPHDMMNSYVAINSHITFTQAQKDTIQGRLSETYIVNTFGPAGLNKSVCDFILFFWNSNTTTALSAKTETKTGATLRWRYPTVYSQNNLPGNITNGLISVSSTDGFSTWSVVDLHGNTFTGSLPSFQYFTGMTSFNGSSNNWTGNIASFAACILLSNFSLSGTTNTGILPSFAACTALTSFDVNGTTFTGTLPSFSACTLLQTFNVSSCTFSGNFPSFASNTALTSLYCTWVGFTGTFASLVNCTNLSILQINGNSFTGTTSDFSGNHITNIRMQQNGFTVSGTSATAFNVACTNFDVSDNSLPTAQVNALLQNIDTYYTAHAPTTNCTFNMGGSDGAATGGQSNTNRLHIISVFTAAGKTATVTNN